MIIARCFCLVALVQLGLAFIFLGTPLGRTVGTHVLQARKMPPLMPSPSDPKRTSAVSTQDMEKFTLVSDFDCVSLYRCKHFLILSITPLTQSLSPITASCCTCYTAADNVCGEA